MANSDRTSHNRDTLGDRLVNLDFLWAFRFERRMGLFRCMNGHMDEKKRGSRRRTPVVWLGGSWQVGEGDVGQVRDGAAKPIRVIIARMTTHVLKDILASAEYS